MNSILKQAIANHPSKDSLDRPDILPWNQLQRLEHYSEPIYEPEKLIPAMKRVSEDSSFVRQGTGYISLQGYDLLARNLSRADVRLLVGSNDVKGRMEVSNSLDGFRDSIQKGPMSSWKIDSAKRMRKEMINGTMRVRCLKARHLPDHHAKVQIYDGSAAILGSANLSWNGFVKNIEGSYVVVGESDVRYFVERFDEYFTEATPIEAELLEILDKSWPIRSEELVDPNDV